MVHVVPWDHEEFFRSGIEHVARVFNFLLEELRALETVVVHQSERTVA